MKVALLGDISLNGKFDFSNSSDALMRVEEIKKNISDCDFIIANLESPLTDKKYTLACKGAYLRSGTKSKELLRYLGITHVTLANNHLFDYGKKGAQDTVECLRSIGIKYVGLNNTPEFLIKGNDKVLLDGFCCYSANALNYGEKEGTIQVLSNNNLRKFLIKAETARCLPIASVHFGIEHVHYPSCEHVALFRTLTEDYKYVLHGHHPHAIQGDEIVNNSCLFYSLGNLCFDDITKTAMREVVPQTQESLKSYIVKLTIHETMVVDIQKIGIVLDSNRVASSNEAVIKEVNKYSEALTGDIKQLTDLRNKDLREYAPKRSKSKVKFILLRLNRPYIIAFLRSRRHAKQYKKTIKE